MHGRRKITLNFWRTVTSVLLLSVYVVFSIGVLKATHVCMGRQASVEYFTSEAKKCPCALFSNEKSDCCHDEQALIKIDNEQKVISSVSAPIPVWKLERLFTHKLLTVVRPVNEHLVKQFDSSPPPPKLPLFKQHRSYVFYEDEHIA